MPEAQTIDRKEVEAGGYLIIKDSLYGLGSGATTPRKKVKNGK